MNFKIARPQKVQNVICTSSKTIIPANNVKKYDETQTNAFQVNNTFYSVEIRLTVSQISMLNRFIISIAGSKLAVSRLLSCYQERFSIFLKDGEFLMQDRLYHLGNWVPSREKRMAEKKILKFQVAQSFGEIVSDSRSPSIAGC